MRVLWLLMLAGCGRVAFDGVDASSIDAPSDPPLDPSLVMWLPMDDDPNDGVTNVARPSRNGYCADVCPTRIAGKRDKALELSDTPIVVDDDATYHLTEGTIALWARIDQLPPNGVVFLATKIFGPNESNTFELFVVVPVGAPSKISSGGDSVLGAYQQSDWAVPLGTWVHVAMTWSPAQVQVFIDTIRYIDSSSFGIAYDGAPFVFGADYNFGAYGGQLVGALDDVRMYSRVLSMSEIQALAN